MIDSSGSATGTLLYDAGYDVVISGGAASYGTFAASGSIYMTLGDSGGVDLFKVKDSGGNDLFGVNSNGDLVRPITNDATALGSYYGRVPIYINGALKYLGVYN